MLDLTAGEKCLVSLAQYAKHLTIIAFVDSRCGAPIELSPFSSIAHGQFDALATLLSPGGFFVPAKPDFSAFFAWIRGAPGGR